MSRPVVGGVYRVTYRSGERRTYAIAGNTFDVSQALSETVAANDKIERVEHLGVLTAGGTVLVSDQDPAWGHTWQPS